MTLASGTGAQRVGADSRVAPVGHCKTSCSDEPVQSSFAQNQDVSDDHLRWCDVAVAVVPGKLEEFQKIESRIGVGFPEGMADVVPPLLAAFGSGNCHAPIVAHGPRNFRVTRPFGIHV